MDDTVATAASDVAHVTVALAIVAPFWSLTVAEIWDVAPSEVKLRLVTERVIEVATGVGVGVGVESGGGAFEHPPPRCTRRRGHLRPESLELASVAIVWTLNRNT